MLHVGLDRPAQHETQDVLTTGSRDRGATIKLVEQELAAIGSADNLVNIRPPREPAYRACSWRVSGRADRAMALQNTVSTQWKDLCAPNRVRYL